MLHAEQRNPSKRLPAKEARPQNARQATDLLTHSPLRPNSFKIVSLLFVAHTLSGSYPAKLHPKHVCQMCANPAKFGEIRLCITKASALTIY